MTNNLVRVDSNIDDGVMRIELFLSNQCNYKCWYCFPGFNEGTHLWPHLDDLIPNLDHMLNYFIKNQGKKKFNLHIIGGEPTLWKDLGTFIKHFRDNFDVVISCSTNASRTIRWWKQYGHYFDQIMISAHHERVDVDHVIQVADILYEKKVWVNTNVLMDPYAWDKCKNIVKQLRNSKHRWAITATELHQDKVELTSEQKKYFKYTMKRMPNPFYFFKCRPLPYKKATITFDNGKKKRVPHNYIQTNDLHHFVGWSCNIGLDTLFVDKDGSIKGGCGSTLYNLGFHYNLFDKDFIKKFNPKLEAQICYRKDCVCMPETNCNKFKLP